jgi:hypothetical protein
LAQASITVQLRKRKTIKGTGDITILNNEACDDLKTEERIFKLRARRTALHKKLARVFTSHRSAIARYRWCDRARLRCEFQRSATPLPTPAGQEAEARQ